MWTVRCPKCNHVGTDREFDVSQADECECPKCEFCFNLYLPDEEEDEEWDPDYEMED